ncbi:hypothetical protein Ddc_05188 [Ditylenchus destructor]|nr:hypothetical protein Ddc_05188 [Ditylenchus destructor]
MEFPRWRNFNAIFTLIKLACIFWYAVFTDSKQELYSPSNQHIFAHCQLPPVYEIEQSVKRLKEFGPENTKFFGSVGHVIEFMNVMRHAVKWENEKDTDQGGIGERVDIKLGTGAIEEVLYLMLMDDFRNNFRVRQGITAAKDAIMRTRTGMLKLSFIGSERADVVVDTLLKVHWAHFVSENLMNGFEIWQNDWNEAQIIEDIRNIKCARDKILENPYSTESKNVNEKVKEFDESNVQNALITLHERYNQFITHCGHIKQLHEKAKRYLKELHVDLFQEFCKEAEQNVKAKLTAEFRNS